MAPLNVVCVLWMAIGLASHHRSHARMFERPEPSFMLTTMASGTLATQADDDAAAFRPPADPASSDSSSPVATANETATVDTTFTCFYAAEELCTEAGRPDAGPSSCRECFAHPTQPNSLVCCNVLDDIERAIACVPLPDDSPSSYWLNIHIRNASLDELDFSQNYWKRLESLSVTDGNVSRIVREFSKFSSPQCVNVSNNHLHSINPRAFKELTRLQVLDLSHNNLSTIPHVNNTPANLTLDVSENKRMLCKSILELMERDVVQFRYPHRTSCLTNQTFTWFNSTDSVVLNELEILRKLQSECPVIPPYGSCKCDPDRIKYDEMRRVRITAMVDCSNMGLTELPQTLPENTILLNVSRNNITSLIPFNLPSYAQISKLEADDNQIHSLLDLEGTKFLQNFLILRLRRNRITHIPMYMMSNTLDKGGSPAGRVINLEGNRLHCDCNTATVLKLWLIAREGHITDAASIGCLNSKQKVLELSEMKLCQSPQDWTDYIYYLIALEIVLLVLVISKVSYDYWVFKTAGYLPWPASKMPKLPCDWLCES